MASPMRPRLVPQCTACLRNYALGRYAESEGTALRQQIRGKKKMPNNSAIITVRLLKDVKAYGRTGSLVPISPGAMRNTWFPSRIAEYVTVPELKRLRLNNIAAERDFEFDLTKRTHKRHQTPPALDEWKKDIPNDIKRMTNAELRNAGAFERAALTGSRERDVSERQSASSAQKAFEMEKLSPERSVELIDLFVPRRGLEFYRQPIIEDTGKDSSPLASSSPERPQVGGIAGDLLAARAPLPKQIAQAIYGSVSVHDVLVATRAVMGDNDEAARVVLQEEEIRFVDLPHGLEGTESGRLKHVGEFTVEVGVRGAEGKVRRVVKVLPQEV